MIIFSGFCVNYYFIVGDNEKICLWVIIRKFIFRVSRTIKSLKVTQSYSIFSRNMPNKLRKIKFTMFKKGKGRGRNIRGGSREEEKERHHKSLLLSI